MNIFKLAMLALVLAAPARAVEYTTNYYQIKYSTPTGRSTESVSGFIGLAASSNTASTFKIWLDGFLGQGVFRGVGASTFSVVSSSGMYVGTNAAGGGGVYAAFFKAVTGFYGNLVGNVTGNLVGNVTGNVTGNADTATLAASATAVAAGAVGQFLYQSGSGATAFLPAMGLGGMISGNGTSAIPSTGTVTGTASQVVLTRTGSNLVFSLPATINVNTSGTAALATAADHTPTKCSAGSYPLGVDTGWNAQNCTAGGVGDVVSNSSQILSGYDQFTSSISIGYQVFSTTINPTSLIVNGWTTVVYSTFPAQGEIDIYNFISTVTYRIHIDVQPSNDNALLQMRLGYSGALLGAGFHSYTNTCRNSAGSDVSTQGQSVDQIRMVGGNALYGIASVTNNATYIGDFYAGTGWISGAVGSSVWYMRGHATYYENATSDMTVCTIGATTQRTTTLGTPYFIKIFPSAGNIRGRVWVEQMTVKQAL